MADMALRCWCKDERAAGNPVASLIRSLALERNRITLALPDWLEEGMQDEEAPDKDSADEVAAPAPAAASVALPATCRLLLLYGQSCYMVATVA